MAKGTDDFSINVRRLIFFHHESAREASKVIGIAEQGVSAWLNGRRRPNLDTLLRIANIYEVDPRALTGDPVQFAQRLADPDRIAVAERNIRERLVEHPRQLEAVPDETDIGEYIETISIEPKEIPSPKLRDVVETEHEPAEPRPRR